MLIYSNLRQSIAIYYWYWRYTWINRGLQILWESYQLKLLVLFHYMPWVWWILLWCNSPDWRNCDDDILLERAVYNVPTHTIVDYDQISL